MATTTSRDVANFFELRQGLQLIGEFLDGMADFRSGALRFLDANGIALEGNGHRPAARGLTGRPPGPNGKRPRLTAGLREQIKRTYQRRAPLRQTSDIEIAPKARKLSYAEKKLETRRVSARVLDALDRTQPRLPIPEGRKAIGALMRRGYVKRKGDGYVRTAKVYVAEEGHVARPPSPFDATGAVTESADKVIVAEAAGMIGVSDSYVRILIKEGKLKAGTEMRVRAGMKNPAPTMVLDRDAVVAFAADYKK